GEGPTLDSSPGPERRRLALARVLASNTMQRGLLLVVVLGLAPVRAGSTGNDVAQATPPTTRSDAPRSVYRLDLAWAIPVSVVAAAGILVPYAMTDTLIHPHCPCPTSEVPWFDRWALGYASDTADILSTVTAGLAYVVPLTVDFADVGASTAFLEDGFILGQTLLVNGALVAVAKYTGQRPIPRVYSPGTPAYVNSPSDYRSFYSGHTSSTFAALTAMSMTWTLRHGDTWWPWVVTAVVGTSVGLERIFAGRHFPSDVLVGAAAGTLLV